MKSVYLAAPLFTPYQKEVITEVTDIMEQVGLKVFSPLEESKHIWAGRPPAECSSEDRKAVMQMNKDGIMQCDMLFAWLGGWPELPDTGVVWEMGYANSHLIPTLAYLHQGEGGRSFNLMLSETVDGMARGLVALKLNLAMYKKYDRFGSVRNLASEGSDFSG